MSLKYLQNHQIDKSRWDDCVANSVNGIIYAYTWYLDMVCDDWDAIVDGDYERIFPLPFKKKFGVHLVFQPFFTQQLGVISKQILTAEIVTSFLKAIPSKFRHVEINLNSLNKVNELKFNVIPQLNHELDLINSYINISKKFSENLKRKLKKTATSGLFINPSTKPDEIIKLFTLNRGKDFPHLRESDFIRLRRLVYAAIHRGGAQIYGVYTRSNILCAGGIFVEANRKLVFLFSGADAEAKKMNAMAFMLDYVIKRNSGKHLTLDFEGSNNVGLARFYKSFGPDETRYFKVTINRLNVFCKIGMMLWRNYRNTLLTLF